MPEHLEDKTIFSLLEVAKSIQKAISERYKSLYWIKAEMNKLNFYPHSGHCYPELVEKKDGKIVAEMRAILWKADYNRINTNFQKVLQEPLREGITMLFQAAISYDPLYGFSLRIVDIDPTFALGELEKEKKESIRKLQEEGIFQANKSIAFPQLPKRIAVISVESSKGFSDFQQIISQNPWGYHMEIYLFPALLQGDKSIPSIIKQLTAIAEQLDNFDVVAIIRGGGGEVGLSSYNNYLLARAIAIFPIPVLTGIGHSTNETVSEMVAYKNAITPSELADFVIQKFHNFSIPVTHAQETIIRCAKLIFEQQQRTMDQLANRINWSTKQHFKTQKLQLKNLEKDLNQQAKQLLREQLLILKNIGRIVQLADPKNLLGKGFSVTHIHGKLLTSTSQLKLDDFIETTLEHGTFVAKVTAIDTHINTK
ncbi:exodeoxyribonuclease VII large subunit [Sphingobacteriaceae bacterium WQ 2009]|uniref:Exodeoxyribonuclease 7 large subunit n=1 Tax=Rhinopithecimicrobium faecis TaxID=2820698 RepID=A0A8T4H796_9SPHI|nr:exodeoxyribonuclease VII large subunit [Sphingobacteriaceae bacterium WQ 2009]